MVAPRSVHLAQLRARFAVASRRQRGRGPHRDLQRASARHRPRTLPRSLPRRPHLPKDVAVSTKWIQDSTVQVLERVATSASLPEIPPVVLGEKSTSHPNAGISVSAQHQGACLHAISTQDRAFTQPCAAGARRLSARDQVRTCMQSRSYFGKQEGPPIRAPCTNSATRLANAVSLGSFEQLSPHRCPSHSRFPASPPVSKNSCITTGGSACPLTSRTPSFTLFRSETRRSTPSLCSVASGSSPPKTAAVA